MPTFQIVSKVGPKSGLNFCFAASKRPTFRRRRCLECTGNGIASGNFRYRRLRDNYGGIRISRGNHPSLQKPFLSFSSESRESRGKRQIPRSSKDDFHLPQSRHGRNLHSPHLPPRAGGGGVERTGRLFEKRLGCAAKRSGGFVRDGLPLKMDDVDEAVAGEEEEKEHRHEFEGEL